ncbi:SGNH/GDSL hydrolase family protein [Streptomyces lasalocidi]|uniref:SGNH/GDSL hydrolase family protein n=1 Tax=Streptomyces lasalocidi TaxID=324833 RepID=UPI001F4FE655|nr:SGNH/GDSL hydrolase family protein [Streptomyces lasalocidi]
MTTAADIGGLKILAADSKDAYVWRTVATLAEPGLPADTWIGNACAMDRDHVAAVYAPRTFTNKPDLMQGGAFTALIDVKTEQVTKLPFTASLAYFAPSCNPQTHTAVFTAFRDNHTRLVTVTKNGETTADDSVAGQVTSAVPVDDGVVAARGQHLIHLDLSGKERRLAGADSVPYQIRPTRDGIAFLDHIDDTAHARLWSERGKPLTLAAGKVGDLALKQGTGGRVFLTGHAENVSLAGSAVTRLNASADAQVSSHGRLAVDPVLTPGVRAGLDHISDAGKSFTKAEPAPGTPKTQDPTDEGAAPLTITSTAPSTGEKIIQAVLDTTSATGKESFSPALDTTGKRLPGTRQSTLTDDERANNPVDTDRWCSIPRNDVKALALQPTPNQVEWAVDMAIRGELRATWVKQGGWRSQAGLGTVDPQGLFPPPTLKGGGRIPAQVLLGVLAQESNLWQAESGSIPGQMGNPLAAIAGFYGHKGDTTEEYWKIYWQNSDCGYGVGQVTDGMRLAGHEKPGETSLPPAKQKAVALDYAVNIAASMYILADKWNEVHTPGQTITVNNDDPSKPENWFAALWNYNLGFNPNNGDGKPWGLGWYNNPANPIYPPSRHPFMTDPHDAAKPQDWPYEEKVMGWSAWSIDTGYSYSTEGRQDWPGESGYSTVGFRPAWWINSAQRDLIKPPLDAFCNPSNNCNAASPPDCPDAECYKQYWWHGSNVTWKQNCATDCGNENIKYATLRAEPGRGYRLQYGAPTCGAAPAGALIVESVPDNLDTYSDCGSSGTDAGHFQFTFYPNPSATGPGLGPYQAKGDLHQIGGGHGGHFWYTHTRDTAHLGGDSGLMTVKGTWTLDRNVEWARVLVHLPDTGAHTRQAAYVIGGSDSTSSHRIVEQRANRWVSLGAFRFTGTPSVTLTNATDDGTADEDVAWDAVAFQPLPGKPNKAVVAMGDSYSSGEGASDPGGNDYYPESDYAGKVAGEKVRDDCHRSKYAWTRRAILPGEQLSTGELDDAWSARMDYHLVACSGARHYNILNTPQTGELPQIQQGYLDQNTTLVALSIGGNDMAFGDVIKKCITAITDVCQNKSISNRDPDTGEPTAGDTPALKDWLPSWAHDTIRPRLSKTLNELHKKAPNAKIVLMGYPRLLERNGQCVSGIGTEEAPWLNDMGDLVAAEMKGAVGDANLQYQANAVFADPRPAFAGQAICGDPETIHGIVLTGQANADSTPSMKSFHPKVSGTMNYAKAFEDALR